MAKALKDSKVSEMIQDTAVRLLFLVFALVVLHETQPAHGVSSCATKENQHLYPFAPSLEISIVEFPNQDVLPTGYNITIICTSNYSKEDWGFHFYSQPYWIQHFFNVNDYIGDCGGSDGDNEDSKVCTYVIQNATERDSGSYSCVAHNQISCTFGTIVLHFEKPSPPQFILAPPHHMNVFVGSSLNLTCEATGLPRPVISWYKDGQPVTSRGSITRVNGISLLPLKNVQPHDQGEYWCEAENAEGWGRTSTTRLKLFLRPTILLHPKDVSIYLHDEAITVNFTCKANGFPPPAINWLKNNSTVTRGTIVQNESISSLVLRLQNKEELPGKYRCIAVNLLGRTTSKEAALVIIRPRTHSSDHIPTSPGFSRVVWISVAIGTVLLFTVVVTICLVRNKCMKANYEINKEMKEEQRFPHLHVRDTTDHRRDDWTTPRYQMTNMA